MAKIDPKGSGKRLEVREKSGNFQMDIEWQPCALEVVWKRLPAIQESCMQLISSRGKTKRVSVRCEGSQQLVDVMPLTSQILHMLLKIILLLQ